MYHSSHKARTIQTTMNALFYSLRQVRIRVMESLKVVSTGKKKTIPWNECMTRQMSKRHDIKKYSKRVYYTYQHM